MPSTVLIKLTASAPASSHALAISDDRILLNGSPAKPSKEVKVGDHLTISYGKRVVEVKITSLLDSTKKADASFMYEFIGETTR